MRNRLALLLSLILASPTLAQKGTPNSHIVQPTPTPGRPIPDAPMLPYHFVKGPRPPAGQKFGNVSAVSVLPNGHIVVFDRNPVIMMMEYDANGKFLRAFNPNIAMNAHGMRIDRHGNIWAIDSFLNVVWKLNSKGEPIMMLGTKGEIGPWDNAKWNHKFNQPSDIAFDKDDNFYITQSHGGTSPPPDCTLCATYKNVPLPVPQGSDPRVLKFDKKGNYRTSLALPHADGTYPTIHTVIVAPNGEVWVADRQMRAIHVLDANLKPLREIKMSNLISGLFVDAKGQLWMSAGMDGMIMKIDWTGKVLGWTGKAGRDVRTNEIGEAHYLSVTPDERTIYIADSINANVLELKHD